MEVEVIEEASSGRASSRFPTTLLGNNTPGYPVGDAPVVVVRVEEVLLVALVLIIWVAAIALFFNRWGKIRMLEPYQPKFHQQPHRPSCPLAPLSPPGVTNQVSLTNSTTLSTRAQKQPTARMSFSKYNVNALTDPLSVLPSPIIKRPRQNSVFVGSSTVAMLNPPPRRVKSAIDIQHLVVNEHSPTTSLKGSIIPVLNKERRPSLITIERPYYTRHHRPSITIERAHVHQARTRRLSCFAERPYSRHRNFISFEHSFDRKPIEKPSCSYHPTISFETPMESMEIPTLPLELPPLPVLPSTGAIPKASRSFEQPKFKDTHKPERNSHSLDVSSLNFERRCSIPEEDRGSSIYINLDETKITAPLLEGLKSSDV
ncbi:uncharacterized protein LOC130898680 isoform X2 [Diorhabda carinulata]|uniref:uncharacterized protein LOC130898680 isoform X2 n=1 Tax=Diorhabda carinulata TaxID=1163345 RepID=UPI0025A1783C|nr:uncharacterized protein LOC130898680 isoform X2 [Diorhabda carinulata]XP_057664117.1 uncharacterized protein LOC130898680 isoform X2 [Diorhabda carinulata]